MGRNDHIRWSMIFIIVVTVMWQIRFDNRNMLSTNTSISKNDMSLTTPTVFASQNQTDHTKEKSAPGYVYQTNEQGKIDLSQPEKKSSGVVPVPDGVSPESRYLDPNATKRTGGDTVYEQERSQQNGVANNPISTTDDDIGESMTTNKTMIDLSFDPSLFPLPDWMEAFFRSQPRKTHLQSLSDPGKQFIVMTCHKHSVDRQEECGGFSDRMALLPYFVWLANQTQRMLLIKYTKPHALEEYLVPSNPENFDWRVPDGFFESELIEYANRTFKQNRMDRKRLWYKDIVRPEYIDKRVVFTNNNIAIPRISPIMKNLTGFGKRIFW